MSKIHYAISGEWGGERVCCNRYFTTDVQHTGVISKVTCQYCLKAINKPKREKGTYEVCHPYSMTESTHAYWNGYSWRISSLPDLTFEDDDFNWIKEIKLNK